MAKLLVVVGATGSQGRAVIRFFKSNEPTWTIRGLTRNPTSPAAVELSSSGVQIVKADLGDPSSLRSAFQGANYIYAYTDFGGITKSPRVMGKFMAGELSGPVGKESFDIEVSHGRNVADAAASISTLERLIWSSLTSASKWTDGKYTHVYNFDSKAAVMVYMFGLEGLRSKVSGLQLGLFADNFFSGLDLFKIRVEGQMATWKTLLPADTKQPWIDVERDLGGYIKALIDFPAPIEVLAVSEWKTPNEWMQIWSQTTGIPGRYEETSTNTPVTDDPTGLKLTSRQMEQFVAEFGYTGGDPSILGPEDLRKKGLSLQLTPVKDYMSRADWSSITG